MATKFGTEKAKVIFCFRNGDVNHKGERIVLTPQNFRTMDQLKDSLTQKVRPTTGPVRKIYTPTGKLINDFAEFEDTASYICCAGDPFSTEKMSKHVKLSSSATPSTSASSAAITRTATTTATTATTATPTPTVESQTILQSSNNENQDINDNDNDNENAINEENIVTTSTSASSTSTTTSTTSTTSAPSTAQRLSGISSTPSSSAPRSGRKIEKFGTQAEKALFIYCYRNGDKHHKGIKLTVNFKRVNTFEQLKLEMTNQVQLVTGAVKKVCRLDGSQVRGLEELVDNTHYICCGPEAFDRELMPLVLLNQLTNQ
eukprot:TRINITY_DN123_c0_g1_i1.p1 TRINITY_DN123_c0_g1~~TRINITY_DN123_c0_g1_i1.p1  ORF type:complete len:316 (-),score=170.32 TRINITY_DN123_c0_g1_i1:49-996(-)